MRVSRFRLSGGYHYGEEADAMFRAAAPFGFDEVHTGSDLRGLRGRGVEHVADVGISGVSAGAELTFDSPAEMLAWAMTAPLVEPAEPNATNAYRAILAAIEPDCPHSALDSCNCYSTEGGSGDERGG